MKKISSSLTMMVTMALILLVSACSSVTFSVMRPGEANLRGVKVIAVAEISGGTQAAYRYDLNERITSAFLDCGYFEKVVDRQNLSKLALEYNLTLAGMTDEAYAVGVGKIISAANLFFGRMNDDYNEDLKKELVDYYNPKTKQKTKLWQYTRTGTFTLTLNAKIINTTSSELIAAKSFSVKRTQFEQKYSEYPDEINVSQLHDQCAADLVDQLMVYLVPHRVNVSVELAEDKKLPTVKNIIKFLNAGETDTALELLAEAADQDYSDPKVKAKALYNYGIILAFAGKYDDGIALLQQAMRLDPSEDRIADGLKIAKSEKANAQKVEQQLSK